MSNKIKQQRWYRESGRDYQLPRGAYNDKYYRIDLGCYETCTSEHSCSEDSCEDLSHLSKPSFQRKCPPLHATCTNTDTEPEPCECKKPVKKFKPFKPPSKPCKPKHSHHSKTSSCDSDSSWTSYTKK